ncbi:MAG: sigma-70 family RNA polymerase sigma factor [Acidobacteriota bacterium]
MKETLPSTGAAPESPVTRLLISWRAGNSAALDELTPMVYSELRRLAQSYMSREAPEHMLQPTALVHEAYLRLVGLDVNWHGRQHFFAVAARLMRRILIDFARQQAAAKRGGPERPLALDGLELAIEQATDLLALDDALQQLAAIDERKARVVELRFFAGLTIDETADVLEVSHATVERDLKLAKAWLAREMDG